MILVSHNPTRAKAALRKLEAGGAGRATLEVADLSSLDSVRGLADRILGQVPELDLIVNNAGIFRPFKGLSVDGVELTMAVNYLGHYLLTRLLKPLWEGRPSVVVNVSSDGHRSGDLRRRPLEDVLRGVGRYRGLKAYGDSKLANILFTLELRRRYGDSGLKAAALHPGVLATRIWNRHWDPLSLFMRVFKPVLGRPRTGAAAVLNIVDLASASHDLALYFDKKKPGEPADQATDEQLAKELWDLSEAITGTVNPDSTKT